MEGTPQHQRSEVAAKVIEIQSGAPDAYDEIEEVLEHPPIMWTPKGVPEGTEADKCLVTDRVAGLVETVEERTGDYGPYLVLVLVTKDRGRVQVAGFGTVLAGWFKVFRPGDMVGIKFAGSVASPTPGFKPYDAYQVAVRRNGRPVSQGRVLGEDDKPGDEESGDLPMASDA
jgi:hypothetical protein